MPTETKAPTKAETAAQKRAATVAQKRADRIAKRGYALPLVLTCHVTKKTVKYTSPAYIDKVIAKAGSLKKLQETYVSREGRRIEAAKNPKPAKTPKAPKAQPAKKSAPKSAPATPAPAPATAPASA